MEYCLDFFVVILPRERSIQDTFFKFFPAVNENNDEDGNDDDEEDDYMRDNPDCGGDDWQFKCSKGRRNSTYHCTVNGVEEISETIDDELAPEIDDKVINVEQDDEGNSSKNNDKNFYVFKFSLYSDDDDYDEAKEVKMNRDELVCGALESAFWAMDRLIFRDKQQYRISGMSRFGTCMSFKNLSTFIFFRWCMFLASSIHIRQDVRCQCWRL